jgi:hypothetical protein
MHSSQTPAKPPKMQAMIKLRWFIVVELRQSRELVARIGDVYRYGDLEYSVVGFDFVKGGSRPKKGGAEPDKHCSYK